ncbi:hypothetical protein RCL_jg27811.t1 [Rhizophagus clarus]|uniref:Uncharacterized protein n=1 Tax=Rhizophagus clarus TaxID=94130 RepID=A0A8H3LCA1_9GLOM|nr:hypothetical protein RCL_jg27811.t1 [Rhizophagus clarus]
MDHNAKIYIEINNKPNRAKYLLIFQIHSELENAREANEIYDTIKEEGSTRILGHLMRVPASSYFFALLHLRKISEIN